MPKMVRLKKDSTIKKELEKTIFSFSQRDNSKSKTLKPVTKLIYT